MGISMSYIKERELALEITNDTFLKFFGTIQKLDVTISLKAWLRKIAVNTAIDYYRKNKKFQNHLEVTGELVLPSNSGYALDDLALQDILDIISRLPEDFKMVFNLYEVEGFSHKEIAEQLGISESSSRVYLTRAKVKLRELVHFHLNDYEGRKA